MRWLSCLRRWGVFLAFLTAGAILIATYAHVEPFDGRSHDRGSYLYYIGLVLKTHRVPAANDCWECHQPPAYFELAAWMLEHTHSQLPPEWREGEKVYRGARVLQGIGAAFALGTLAFWLLTVRTVLTSTYEQVMASAMLAFWPTLAIDGSPIGSDGFVSLVVSASLWLLALWRRNGQPWALVGGVIAAGLGGQVKANGLVAIPVAVVSLTLAIVRKQQGRPRWPRGATAAVAALCVLIGAWGLAVHQWKQGQFEMNVNGLGPQVPTGLRQLLHVDFTTFWKTPFCDFNDPGSADFWPFFFRSALFGEYSSGDHGTRVYGLWLVLVAGCLLPLLAAGFVMCVVRGFRPDDKGHREMVVALIGLVFSVLTLRVKHPWLCHTEFRYCLSAAAPAAIMVALGSGALRRKLLRRWPHLAALPGGLVAAFCVLSTHILLVWP